MSNKQRLIVLLVSIVIGTIFCYQLAFSKTFALKKQYKKLSQQEILYRNAPKQLTLIKRKQQYYDSILNKYQLKGSSIQNNLLKHLTVYSKQHKLKLIDFLEPHVSKNKDATIKTYQFSLEGDYNNILVLIHSLEQETKFGEIINLHFEKLKNYRTGRHYLQARVLLRSFN
jgi:hypothetical protein